MSIYSLGDAASVVNGAGIEKALPVVAEFATACPAKHPANGGISRIATAALFHAERLVAAWLPDGKRDGREWVSRNPTRVDDSPGSFKVNLGTGRWSDFATGDKGGDLVSLRAYLDGVSQMEAARRVAAEIGLPGYAASKPQGRPGNPLAPSRRGKQGENGGAAYGLGNGREPATVAKPSRSHMTGAHDAPEPSREDFRHGTLGLPASIWPLWAYHHADGTLSHYRARYDRPDGGKDVLPWSWDGARWRCKAPDGLFPLYRLAELIENEAAPVLIVEGEKTADAAARLFPGHNVVTSAGGSGQAKVSDWCALHGRVVVIWPDNDGRDDGKGVTRGLKYAADVARFTHDAGAASVAIVAVPETWPTAWDVADALPHGVTVETLARMIEDAAPREPQRESETDARKDPAPNDASPDEATARGSGPHAHQPDVQPWPELSSTAMWGLAGEIARLATENSEADPVAVLMTTLTWGGATFGRNRFLKWGETHHHARLFSAIVGASSRARKGTSVEPVRRFFKAAEERLTNGSMGTLAFPSGLRLSVIPGPLSSGEGLIHAIRDPSDEKDDEGKPVIAGVVDKRLLCIEGEFGAVLRAFQRQGNTLSTILRTAWDGLSVSPLTKHNKETASDPHISIVAHITGQELRALMSAPDIWNGFANRFLWASVRRSKIVAIPQAMPDENVARIGSDLAQVIARSHGRDGVPIELRMTNAAVDHWAAIYAELTVDRPGILGAVTARAEAQVLRLAITYALFDGHDMIGREHVEAAAALWRFAADSARFVFGAAEIDPHAQKIIESLNEGPKTQNQLNEIFGGHVSARHLAEVLDELQSRGRITLKEEKTGGRPRKMWSVTLAGKAG